MMVPLPQTGHGCPTKVSAYEKKVILDSLRKLKKVEEFREIAGKIKKDIAFEWNANADKIYIIPP